MTIPLPTDILKVPIADITQFSKKFRDCCKVCGFITLQDICRLGAHEVSKTRHLGPFYFRELVDFLKEQRLLHALAD